ncbi:hypothetical protein K438DRAFT_1780381 [Mycena galopus ATCC 62051]|nr:hypothetical protein K438DRAFT_1780381 [Mycena galopus ATCC 62051]
MVGGPLCARHRLVLVQGRDRSQLDARTGDFREGRFDRPSRGSHSRCRISLPAPKFQILPRLPPFFPIILLPGWMHYLHAYDPDNILSGTQIGYTCQGRITLDHWWTFLGPLGSLFPAPHFRVLRRSFRSRIRSDIYQNWSPYANASDALISVMFLRMLGLYSVSCQSKEENRQTTQHGRASQNAIYTLPGGGHPDHIFRHVEDNLKMTSPGRSDVGLGAGNLSYVIHPQ